jgi:beta propeller repeat protein
MATVKRIILALVGFVLAVGACSTASAESRITTNAADQNYPAIWANIVAWHDSRNGNSDIYAYNIATTQEVRITTDTANQFYPDVSSSIITWDDFRNGTWDIYYYDLTSGSQAGVVIDPAGQSGSAASGYRVVWTDTRASNADIYYKDVSTGSGKALITYMTHQTQPDISGDLVIWTDKRAGATNIDIWGYNLATSQPFQVTFDTHNQQTPAISGQRVVWQDDRNGNWDIYMRDMSGGAEIPICTAAGDQTEPAIDGDIILWTDMRNGNPDIYMFDLATSQEYPVCIDPATQQHPAVSQCRAVWADNRNGNWDIYMADVGDPQPPTVALTSPAQGATLTGTVNVAATASDNVAVSRVDFLLDDAVVSSDTTEPYQWQWNTIGTPDGAHVVKAKAYDTSNNWAQDLKNVSVDNAPPSAAITSPAASSWVSGTVNVNVSAVDAVAVNRVEFRVGGVLRFTDYAAPFSWAWNTLAESNGAHVLRATAYDGAGHSAYDERSVSVDNTTPSVSLTTPGEGAVVRDTVAVQAAASDTASGVSRVELYLDGVLVKTCTVAPYSWQWDTVPCSEGAHVVAAAAIDQAGNRATDTRGVTVDNTTFDDVLKTSLYWAYVEALVREGITSGCSGAPPLYCPTASVTRAQMAKFLCIAAGKQPLDSATPTFADVPKTNWAYGYIERLADPDSWGGTPPTSGIACPPGVPPGSRCYGPFQSVTREQMAKFLCLAASKPAMPSCSGTFADVASGWACPWIERLAHPGSWGGTPVTSGCACPLGYPGGARCYCPKENCTRAQMAKFLVLAFAIPL